MCAGLLVAGFKAQGGSLYNGSNTIWRKYLTESGSISDHKSSNGYPKNINALKSSQLKKGMAVFKWNSHDTSKYPDGQGDYQHIGLVTSVNPLHIVHASSEYNGIVVDKSVGKFCAWGKLKGVDYGQTNITPAPTQEEQHEKSDEGLSLFELKIKADPRLNIREQPTKKSDIIGHVAKNAIVKANDLVNGFYKLADRAGYISADYVIVLSAINNDIPAIEDEVQAEDDLESRVKALEKRVTELEILINS